MEGSVADVLHSYEYLLVHLQTERDSLAKRAKLPTDTIAHTLLPGIDAALTKLQKYYSLTHLSPAYIISTICDPRRGMKWIEWAWGHKPEWIERVKVVAKEVFDQYKDTSTDLSRNHGVANKAQQWGAWPRKPPVVPSRTVSEEEYESWINFPSISDEEDPMEFWRNNKKQYPTWVRIAFDFLSIPAMSAEIERIFSRYNTLFEDDY